MEVFCKFRTVKRILRLTIAVLLFTFHSVSIYGEYYLWTGEGADAKWTTIENWVTFDENDDELPATKYPGKNQADNDSIEFSGENENYIIVDKTVYLDIINFNTVDSNRITLEFLESTTTCNSNIIFLVDKTTNNTSGNVVLTGPGTLITSEFDFPNQGGNHEHTFVIGSKPSDNTTTLTVTTTLWANSEKKLTFSGNGYLYMPLGGGNVNYGGTNITYALDITHRLPYKEGVPTYSCNIDNTDFPIDANKNIVEATITLTKPDYGQPSEESVYFPYTVEVTGNQTYTLYGEGNSETFTTGEHIFQGKKSGTTEYHNNIAKITRGKTTSTFKLALAASDINSLEKGNGIKIIFYSPDGQYPQETFMELGRLVWYYKTPVWTGNGSSQDWTDTDNWEGISGVNLNNLSDYDIEISVKAPKKTPVISNDVSVKSITITSGSNLHLESGKLSTNKIETSHLGSSFTSTNNSIVELANKGGIEPVLKYAFNDSSTINIKNLSIAEGASFTMPLSMDLSMLTINSGASFYKGDKNLSIGWLQIQTANYSDLPSISKNINITEDFEADCIIILLRDGNITTTGKLSARKDFIIGGARYNDAIIKYDKFIERPSDWVQSYTDIDLSFFSTKTENSTFYLSGNAEIKAGTSGKGNFYINGANLEGNPSGGNNIVIPQNDSAENFCADAIFSKITNINVVCSDGTYDDGSPKAMIPTGGCTLSNCNNFDYEDFVILEAETVFDNRIRIKMSAPTRNTQGELNKPELINAVKVSDGNYFTNTYSSADGTELPEATPEEFYIYTSKTSWNMDATGDMNPATVADTCNYTNSKSEWKNVVPYLKIPQQTSTCGYTITDKWGKRINDYTASPFTGTTDGTDKTPTWTGKIDSSWANSVNWYNLNKQYYLEENLAMNDIIIKSTSNPPVISSKTVFPEGESWELKSLTIEPSASLSIENGGALKTTSITNNGNLLQNGGVLQISGTSASITNNGEFSQTGGFLQLTGSTVNIKLEPEAITTIKNLELMPNTTLNLKSNLLVNNLTIHESVTILPDSFILSVSNIIIDAGNSDLYLFDSYSAENLYFKSGTVNILSPISAKNILAYGGTINLSTANSVLNATNDFIILGEGYGSSYNYNHFAARPAGWIRVNIPPSDIGKLPDGTTITEFSANVTAAAGATLSAGTSTTAGESKNLYINKATLTGTGEWFITIPQNDDGAKFCTEAIDSSFTYCTVKCTDGTADGTHAQIPLGNSTTDSHCKNFDKTAFQITAAETVADNRVKITLSTPARNNYGELNNAEVLNNIKVSDGNCFSNAYKTKEGTEPPDAMPEEFYIYTSTTSWNTDASGQSIGSGQYTNSQDVFRKVKPCLTIPQYTINEDGSVKCGFIITDKWGKRLTEYSPFEDVEDGIPESEKHRRSPPQFGTVLCPVGSNKISFSFTRPIVIDSENITYRSNVGSPTTITQDMKVIFARCFELISIDAEGRADSTDLQINKNKKAQIDQYPSGLVVITLQLTRNATLEDIEKLYIRLTTPKYDDGSPMYTPTTFDHVSMTLGTNQVSFIQESDKEHKNMGATFMLINTAHTISDFVINAVSPSYAYSDVTKNIYDSDSIAVHDFSKNQQNYGTLPYGYEFTLISKINLGTETAEESDYPGTLKLFITDSPDSQSLFTTFNANFNRSVSTWLPESTVNSYSVDAFDAYTKKLNPHFWDIPGSPISTGAPSSGYNFIIPKETVTKMKAGSQLSFLYALCDENGTFIPHYLSPECNYTSDPVVYTLPESTKVPLFAFNITNANDLLSLDQWYIKLKNITEQRGGVTILNNVINSAAGEKTTLKVNMAESGKLDVIVMTLDGNIIKYLNRGNVSAGEHYYNWDGKNKAGTPVARGMYFIIVKAPGMDETRKVMVVK